MSLTPRGSGINFPIWRQTEKTFFFFFLGNHALCQCIVPGQGEGGKILLNEDMPKYIFEWCIFGFGFVKGSSGVQLAEAFLCLSRAFAHFHACHVSQDVCEPGLRDWSKLLYRGFAYSPPSLLPMLPQQFPLPFDSHSMADIFCLSWAVESHRHSL